MADKTKLEFFLLRYVPNVVTGQFFNFGLLVFAPHGDSSELVEVRYARSWERFLGESIQIDVDALAKIREELRTEIGTARERASLLRRMEDSFSGVVQISSAMPVLTARTVAEEIGEVARIFLDTEKVRGVSEPAGRRKIVDTMEKAFESAGVLELLQHPLPAEPYSKPGDPFKFDFGYRIGGEIKLFHAVSMRASVDSAVLLAARYGKIAPEMTRLAAAVPSLTAVIESDVDRSRSEVGFAIEMMQESKIMVSDVGEMSRIAKEAARDLNV